MAEQTVIAYFETRTDAENARDALTDEGIAASSIHLLPKADAGYTRGTDETSYDYREDKGGFWASLGNFFMPDDDRATYAEGMSRGGITLSVMADDANYDRVTDILEQHGSVDLDERETEWKREGWTGYQADASATDTSPPGAAMAETARAGATGTTSTDYSTRAVGGTMPVGSDDTIKVMAEQLRVGKRQVDKGRVRVRSYVVEAPVQENVSLHSERVVLERRPVDRALTGTEAAFTDRTIEAQERREEAVVSKDARVVEEINLRRQGEDRTETVSDTVRRTEVEITDERTGDGERLTPEQLRGSKPANR